MFEDAIVYPWRGEQNVKTVAIGGVLGILAIFDFPALFANGSLVRVRRQVGVGDTETPPVFDDWGGLLVDGLVSLLIAFVYLFVTMTLISASIVLFSSFAGAGGGGNAGGGIALLGFVVGLVLVLVSVIVGLAAFYLLPGAVAAYAVTGDLGSAFSPSTLWTVGGDKSYLVGVLIAVLINVTAQIAGSMIYLTIIGILFIPFIFFYGNVASAYAIGAGVAETALVDDSPDTESPADQPAV